MYSQSYSQNISCIIQVVLSIRPRSLGICFYTFSCNEQLERYQNQPDLANCSRIYFEFIYHFHKYPPRFRFQLVSEKNTEKSDSSLLHFQPVLKCFGSCLTVWGAVLGRVWCGGDTRSVHIRNVNNNKCACARILTRPTTKIYISVL